jgi:hypothetical protein
MMRFYCGEKREKREGKSSRGVNACCKMKRRTVAT